MSNSKFARAARTAAACMILTLAAAAAWPSPMYALLLGSVSNGTDRTAPIVVLAVDSRGNVAHRVFLESKHVFQMPLVPGSYKFYAFADENRDGRRGTDEAVSAMYRLAAPLRAGEIVELPAFDIR
ncbi:MAG: hypothetical protein WDO72_03770 [Pseudomonadota bacterium]